MKKFWILYTLLLLTGTMAIYLEVPLLTKTIMPYVPAYLKPNDPSLSPTTFVTNTVKATTVQQGTPAIKQPPKKVELPEEETFVSPAMEGIYEALSNEHPTWGVTHQRTSYYTDKGVYRGLIEGGEIFTCLKKKLNSSKGDLLECQLIAGPQTNGTFLIARKDAYFFTGDFRKLPKKQIETFREYYQLNAKLIERRKKLQEEGATQNPYFQTSRAAYTAMSKNAEEGKALLKKMSTTTNSEKAALDEQLRALKYKEAPLKAAFEAEQRKFVEWKKLHAKELPNPDTDLQMKTWRDQKEKLVPLLRGLAF